MVKATPHIKYSVADYLSLPESEAMRVELLGGDLDMTPGPSPYHQQIARNLGHALWAFVRDNGQGEVLFAPVDVILSEADVAQPDLLFIAARRRGIIRQDAIHGAPDLVVEILSPATAERDRSYKRTLYARAGVREYWLVDPESHAVEVLVLGGKGFRKKAHYARDETLESPLLKRLSVPLREVF